MNFSSLPGFREFYPDELALRNHIFDAWRTVAQRYGFVEYDGPPLEPLELYTAKSGEEIVGQLYSFEDRGGRAVSLRPEMTPTFARMIAARASALPKPIRWFSIPQLFRYERPQRGRLREHFQLNADIVGEVSPLADAEVIAVALDCLRALGLTEADIVVRVSDRRLVSAVLGDLGVPEPKFAGVLAAMDKFDREGEAWMRERLDALDVDAGAIDTIVRLPGMDLDEVAAACGDGAGPAGGPDGGRPAASLRAVIDALRAFGLGDYVRFDAGLVRGLAYYTGTVFEVWERSGELRAVCGGGRYDDLLDALGGTDLPSVGFGMGDVVLGELLKDRGLAPSAAARVDDFVVCVSPEQQDVALSIASRLRAAGRAVTYDLRSRSVGRQFKAAHQAGAARAIVVGPDEVERGVAVVRSMDSGDEAEAPIATIGESTERDAG